MSTVSVIWFLRWTHSDGGRNETAYTSEAAARAALEALRPSQERGYNRHVKLVKKTTEVFDQ